MRGFTAEKEEYMRIITGKARGAVLKTLPGDTTRPTAAKIKEAVFSALQFDLEGRRFLDLFAGSGQMGLEALSRGAASATFVDATKEALDIVKENAEKTRLFPLCRFCLSDYRNFIRKEGARGEKYDLIFIDPPYAARLTADAAERILKASLAKPHTLFIAESEEEDIFGEKPALALSFEILRKKKYGRTTITFFRQKEDGGNEE